MTDQSALLALIEKLEKSEAGSRELDAEILIALNPDWADWKSDRPGDFNHPQYGKAYCPEYSTSLDEALRLVPETSRWSVTFWFGGEYGATCDDAHANFKGHSGPLALCIAALKARAQ